MGLHGKYKWRWGRFRRIGLHKYRLRVLYRNYHGRWRKVRSYWHLYSRFSYRRARWVWRARYKRMGRHLYRERALIRWNGKRWYTVRRYFRRDRRNHYRVYKKKKT